MTVTSLRADEIVKTAEECFSLGLISQEKLEDVTNQAYSVPEYDGWDLPFYWEIQEEKDRRRRANHVPLKKRIVKILQWMVRE